ncbi:MAG: thiamine phosphate synthase [Candidatus Omnitrophica bacterium]|nr:thiamine phosphate synthase [Candidatus Omnitrophota bacterium]
MVDRGVLQGRDPLEVAEAAIQGGADCIQWRDKSAPDGKFLAAARELRELTRRQETLFVVNDRVDVALCVGADAVHLGHEDLPVKEARGMVRDRMAIGRSTHSLEEARQAEADGADYIGVGPVFSTPTKPDYPAVGLELLKQMASTIRIPWVAIGGIDRQKLPLVLSAGASRIAVVRAVAGDPDPASAARLLKMILK